MLSPIFLERSSYRAPPVRTWPFLGRHGLAEKWRLLGHLLQPPRALGLLLGDYLLTMGVRVNLWGTMMLMYVIIAKSATWRLIAWGRFSARWTCRRQ